MISFEIRSKSKNGLARAGIIHTPHGDIETPAFIPVGTKATVKSLLPEDVRDKVCAQAILANTYHLYLEPGTAVLEKAGGLGRFMDWSGPTFTDSGGFQAFSLQGGMQERRSKIASAVVNDPISQEPSLSLAKVDDNGVTFKSIIDGSTHGFTPEKSIEVQHSIGADIIFAFDECLAPAESYERQKSAVERTSRWAKRCLERHQSSGIGRVSRETVSSPAGAAPRSRPPSRPPKGPSNSLPIPALFGIVQGGRYEDLRRQSAQEISAIGFDGFGIGGSFDKDDIGEAVRWVSEELPAGKPRHLLGIGSEPGDLIMGIENGMDTFDCVAPARMARNGAAYVSKETAKKEREGSDKQRINLLNAKYAADLLPIDSTCGCYTCKNHTRAYVAHLFRAKEILAATLTTIHNLYFVVNLVKRAREEIMHGSFEEFVGEFKRLRG